MKRIPSPAVFLGGLLAMALIALILWNHDEGDGLAVAPERPAEAATPAPEPEPGIEAPTPPVPLPAPEIEPALRERLTQLRETFTPEGSLPNRFRLQRDLSKRWGMNPPLDLLLFEATDPAAPPDYRRHFADRLGQLGKRVNESERLTLATEIRQALDTNPAGGVGLAQALVSFDDGPENIRSVTRLLEMAPTDSTCAGLLAALVLSSSPEATSALLEHTSRLTEQPDRHASSLALALPTLARVPEFEVEPLLEQVLVATTSATTYQGTIAAALARPPGSSSLSVLKLAKEQRSRFDSDAQERITAQLRAGVLRWQRTPHDLPPSSLESLLNDLP